MYHLQQIDSKSEQINEKGSMEDENYKMVNILFLTCFLILK